MTPAFPIVNYSYSLSSHRLNPILLNFAKWPVPGISLEEQKAVITRQSLPLSMPPVNPMKTS